MRNKQDKPDYSLKIFDLLSSLFSIVDDDRDTNETNKIIADYLLRNLNNLNELTIYDVAEECFVSRSSIHRFLKLIGIDQFNRLGQFVNDSQLHYQAYYDYANRDHFEDYVKGMMNEMMDDISKVANSNSIKELVEMIHDFEKVHLLTADTSSSAAKHLQEELVAIGKLIYVYTGSKVNDESFAKLTEEDLLIVCSITGNYAFAVNKDISAINATKILITLNRYESYKQYYDYIVYVGDKQYSSDRICHGNRNVYTKYGLLYFFDIVYNAYVKKYGSTYNFHK